MGKGEWEMAEEAVKVKLNNAINSLANQFPCPLFTTIKIKDASCPFHLEVFRSDEEKGNEVFKFRVTLDTISSQDKKLCREYIMPGCVFTKVIACKKEGRGNFEFFTISSIKKH